MMPLAEFYDRLAELALGWLGWSEEQALRSDVNAILVGFGGKREMLKAVYGSVEEADPAKLPEARAGVLGKR